MRWALFVFVFFQLSLRAGEVENENITTFKDINAVFNALGIGNRSKDQWAEILKAEGINPCKPFKSKTDTSNRKDFTQIESTSSGVLTDDSNVGERTLHTVDIKNPKGEIFTVRYTYDWVKTDKGILCGFETFIKKPDGKILGLGMGDKGQILKEVPELLAHDKRGNQSAYDKSKIIKSGPGCFFCHPRVSFSNDMPGAESFWPPRRKTGRPHAKPEPKPLSNPSHQPPPNP